MMGTVDDDAVAVVRRLFDDIFNGGNVDAVAEVVAPNVVGHDAASPQPVRGVERRNDATPEAWPEQPG